MQFIAGGHSTRIYHSLRAPTMVYQCNLTPIDNEESAQVPIPDTSQLDDAALWSTRVNTRGCGYRRQLRAVPLMVYGEHSHNIPSRPFADII